MRIPVNYSAVRATRPGGRPAGAKAAAESERKSPIRARGGARLERRCTWALADFDNFRSTPERAGAAGRLARRRWLADIIPVVEHLERASKWRRTRRRVMIEGFADWCSRSWWRCSAHGVERVRRSVSRSIRVARGGGVIPREGAAETRWWRGASGISGTGSCCGGGGVVAQ